jgi:multidrug efflux system membrane fusion protein
MTRWARGAVPKAARSPRAGAAVALLLVAAVVVALTTSTGPTSAGSTPSGAGKASGAATVQRRDLVQTDTESGTLSYSGPQTVYDRLGGTITWLPQIGQLIRPGQALYDIDNQPIILMNGSTPAYRTLSAATALGPDVLELNRNLVAERRACTASAAPDHADLDQTITSAQTAIPTHIGITRTSA